MESGLVLDGGVLQNTDEEPHLEATEARFPERGLDQIVESLAADGKFVTGPNLAALAQRKTTFYGPIGGQTEMVKRVDGRVERQRDQAAETACASCPLRAQCLQAEAARQTLSHDQYESRRAPRTLIRWCRQHGVGLQPLLASFASFVRTHRRAGTYSCVGARASPALVGL